MIFNNRHSIKDYISDPVFLVSYFTILVLLIACVCIVITNLRKRPRIKKRIIVNKNVTPLTYRPQPPAEQCEITIENCCNMNVCETVSISIHILYKYFFLHWLMFSLPIPLYCLLPHYSWFPRLFYTLFICSSILSSVDILYTFIIQPLFLSTLLSGKHI